MSVDAVRLKAATLTTRARARNLVEYAASAIVVAMSVRIALATVSPLIQIGQVLIALAAVWVVVYMHRRGWLERMADDATPAASAIFYRQQLVRQRDLLREVWRWYLLPFAPGMAFVLVGRVRSGGRLSFAIATAVGAVALALFIAWLNARAARRVQQTIDQLDTH